MRGHTAPAQDPPKHPARGSGGVWPRWVLRLVRVALLGMRCHGAGIVPAIGCPPDGGGQILSPRPLAGAWLLRETRGFPLVMG